VTGVLATQVDADSPAAQAGIRGLERTQDGFDPGDVIVTVDGKAVKTADELYAILERHKPGETITLKIWRRGETQDVKVKLDQPRE
jgi:S1-C subfamily serine protease